MTILEKLRNGSLVPVDLLPGINRKDYKELSAELRKAARDPALPVINIQAVLDGFLSPSGVMDVELNRENYVALTPRFERMWMEGGISTIEGEPQPIGILVEKMEGNHTPRLSVSAGAVVSQTIMFHVFHGVRGYNRAGLAVKGAILLDERGDDCGHGGAAMAVTPNTLDRDRSRGWVALMIDIVARSLMRINSGDVRPDLPIPQTETTRPVPLGPSDLAFKEGVGQTLILLPKGMGQKAN